MCNINPLFLKCFKRNDYPIYFSGFGFTLKSSNDFKLSDFYAGTPETFYPYYGAKDDGNVYDPANLMSLKSHVLSRTEDKGVHFMMADGVSLFFFVSQSVCALGH